MDCVVCSEPITNPICPACLQEGVHQWLLERREDVLASELRSVTRYEIVEEDNEDTICIKCDTPMRLCAYCHTQEIFSMIKDHEHLLTQYLTYFNFDLEHLGWEQDARAYLDVEY